jgi:fructokinase
MANSGRYNMNITAGKKILCIGEILWDLLPDGAVAGGAPMNVALHLKNLGMDVRFAGKTGNDKLGRDLKYFLEEHNLETTLLQTDNELPTSTVAVHLGEGNRVSFEIVDNVAWDRIESTPDLIRAASEAEVIVFGTLASRHSFTRNTILQVLEDSSALKLIDVNLRPPYDDREIVETLLESAGIAKLNNDELKVIGDWYGLPYNEKELVKWFAERYSCSIVCVTRGDQGALLYDGENILEHPGFKVKVRDTVGSGDAFLAGFLTTFLNGVPLCEALEYACATGALVATRAGATPSFGESEITDIIQMQNAVN